MTFRHRAPEPDRVDTDHDPEHEHPDTNDNRSSPESEPLGADGHHRPGRTTGQVEIDTSLRCDNLGAIRDRIAEVLAGHDSTFVHDVQLVTTELASNACDHADQPRHLWLRREVHDRRGAELVVEVRDATPERAPVVGVSRIAPERGNGMKMVEAFCTDWGVRNDEDTKIVWGRIPIP